MELNLALIIGILLNHFVSDFIFQTQQMAENKSTSIKWLSKHVGVYTLTFLPFIILLMNYVSVFWAIIWWLVNSGLHWITDYGTSKLNKYLLSNYGKGPFFKGIGFDQLIHYIILFYTTYLILNL